jgi:hypothetical protein
MGGPVQAVVWDDDSGGHHWTNAVNWVGDVKPTAAQSAQFNDVKVGTSVVDTVYTVAGLYYENTNAASYVLQIAPGASLILNGGYLSASYRKPAVQVVVKNSGMLKVGNVSPTAIRLGYRSTDRNVTVDASLIVQGGVFNLANVSAIDIGVQDAQGWGAAKGLLDVSTATVVSGSITNRFQAPSTRLGVNDASGMLKVNPNVTNLTFTSLRMGGTSSASPGILDLGTNSLLRDLVIADTFSYTYGGFRCHDGSGNTIKGFPGNVTFKMGSESTRAGTLSVAENGMLDPVVMTLGPGIGTFQAYVSGLRVSAVAVNGHHRYGTLDLRNATLAALDVNGQVKIGGVSNHGKVYLPAGRASCTSLQMNVSANATTGAGSALLSLSNTLFTVAGDLLLGDPYTTGFAVITNQINGVCSGIDMTGSLTVTNGGRMRLSFMAPPIDPIRACWGLRMVGNKTTQLNALQTAGKLTWIAPGLTEVQRARVGAYYEPASNHTYFGLPPTRGTLIMFR